MLPAATAILVALGFLRWLGEKQGLYGTGVGIVLLTLTACGVIAGLLPPERRDELTEILAQINRGERVEALETVRTAKDGRAIEVAVTHVMDVSDRKQFEGQLQHLADHDALTGQFNRRRFSEEVERALKRSKRF